METRTIRDLVILLPGDEPEELEREAVVPEDRAAVSERVVTGSSWTRAHLTSVALVRSWMLNADLSSARFDGVTFDRVVLRGCSLIGAHLADATLKNVIFENCRLDFATFNKVRVTGPLAFLGCSLAETAFDHCKLTTVAFDGCRLSATAFEGCDLRGADLRGNDLSAISGIASLRGATISDDQLPSLTETIVRDLALTVTAV